VLSSVRRIGTGANLEVARPDAIQKPEESVGLAQHPRNKETYKESWLTSRCEGGAR
jgi:hypothetical protein